MSESHQNPAFLVPAAPRMAALASNEGCSYADYPESELT